MTRVDFYVLPDDAAEDALPTAYRLCEKAIAGGQRVHVHAPDAGQADAFDKMLWTYRQGSFIAHERAVAGADTELAAVLIGDAEPPAGRDQVLLNLGAEVPAFFSRFERVLEIVAGDAATRAASRARFKWYRDRGYPLETHRL